MHPLERYAYAPLKDCTKQVRLCSIDAGSEASELALTLRIVDLADSTVQFSCLSYVWGDMSVLLDILIDGRQHAVSRNLHLLLYRLRALGLRENLWIDALCIYQMDSVEKTEQVKLMGRIYSSAKEVLVALDEQAPFVSQPEGTNHARVRAAIEGLADKSHLSDVECFLPPGSNKEDGSLSNLFQRLLESPWFSRTWTVQEVCLAQKVKVLLSWGTMPCETFVKAFQKWDQHRRGCCATFTDSLDEGVKIVCYQVRLLPS